MSCITLDAVSRGSASPSLSAFSLNANRMSADILIGLNVLLSIVATSTFDSLAVEDLNASSLIFKILAASISPLNSFLTLNKALFAFMYALTISLGSTGPPRKDSLVNNCLDCLTPL